LEIQRFRRSCGVHPVGAEPVGIAVRVALASGRYAADHTHRGRGRRGDIALDQPVRLVAADQQRLADHRRGRRGDEGVRDIAHVDGLDPAVDGQRRLEVDGVQVEIEARLGGEHAAQP
jgi:hypothetical protein